MNAFSAPETAPVTPAPGSQMVQRVIHLPDATTTRRKQALLPSWPAKKTFSRSTFYPPTAHAASIFFMSIAYAHYIPVIGRGLNSCGEPFGAERRACLPQESCPGNRRCLTKGEAELERRCWLVANVREVTKGTRISPTFCKVEEIEIIK